MEDTVLKLKHVTKSYGKTKVLKDVSITLNRGMIYGLVGNNGAGKTTLMRLISGHTFAESGEIELFGSRDKDSLGKSRRRTGVLIEDPGFFAQMTAEENLEYFRIQFGIPGKAKVQKVLEEVHLTDIKKKKYKNFSVGMKQRLGIALAFMHTPELLILDEPINGLDPAGIIEVRQLLQEINRKKNTTILISSHILEEMSNIATDYGFLSHGRLLEEISAKELMKKCSVFLEIAVDDPKSMCVLLEKEMNYKNYKIYQDGHIHLYEGMDKTEEICKLAVKNHIGIIGINQKTLNLENYYMNIVEGNK